MENEVGPLSQIFTFSVNENLYKREMLKKKKKKRLKTFKHAQCIFHSEHADSVYRFISLQNHTGFHSQLWTKKQTVHRSEITRKTLPEL